MTERPKTPRSITLKDVLCQRPGLLQAECDGEVLALNIEQGNCYGLNPIGSQIWRMLTRPIPVCDICSKLASEYAIDMSTCEVEVLDLLEHLRVEGLIDLANPK